MAAKLVIHSEHIEEERLDVIVQGLVVQEELDQQTQVLTVDLVDVSIHLEHREPLVAVDLVSRRMEQTTLLLQTQ